jgi:Uma2 family endonuclease
MAIRAPIRRLTPAEYLAWEAEQPDRNELVDGIPYAMAGAGRLHEEVALALAALLWTHLRGGSCRVYKSDRRLQVGDDFFYPDIVVTCNVEDRQTDGAIKAPTAIIEVLSRPTAAYDRGEKRERYATLASLETYVVVDPESRAIERYDRTGAWTRYVLAPQDALVIEGIGFSTDQAAIFSTLG